jgi:hypothetical protein
VREVGGQLSPCLSLPLAANPAETTVQLSDVGASGYFSGVIWFSRRQSLRYPPENTHKFKTVVLKLVGRESYNSGMRKNSFGYAGKKVILIKISGGYQAMINGQHFAIRAMDRLSAMIAIESIIDAGGSI